MPVSKAMNINPVRIRETATFSEAAEMIAYSHVSALMVVDEDNRFVGVLSEGDLLRSMLPNYSDLTKDGALVSKAFELFIDKGMEFSHKPVTDLIIRTPISFKSSDKLLRAATTMITKHLHLLPVVDDGVLVGTISRGNICKHLLAQSR